MSECTLSKIGECRADIPANPHHLFALGKSRVVDRRDARRRSRSWRLEGRVHSGPSEHPKAETIGSVHVSTTTDRGLAVASSDLLGSTISLASSTVILAFVAGLMPRLVGDEPNAVVGIRTKATRSSPEAWQLAHEVARPYLRWTMWTAVAGLCIQVVVGVSTGFGSVLSAIAAFVVFLAVLVVLTFGALKGNSAAKSLRS